MRLQYKNNKLKFYIGDTRELSSIQDAMRGVHYVFHAAAFSGGGGDRPRTLSR
jgi:UDP-glucose 4-epimerase